MHSSRSFALLPLLALCAGCVASAPPKQGQRTLSASQRPEMLTRLGDDMRRNGDAPGAVGLYRAASLAAPHDPAPLERMGDAFMDMNDPARAEQAFRGELVIDPANVVAERGLALALLGQRRAAEALPILHTLAQGSSDPALLRAEGTALDMVGQPKQAQDVYRRALQLAPIDANLHGNLALSLALSGDGPNALTEMQAAIASPNPDPRQAANAVLVLALTGNAAAAQARGEATIGAPATEVLMMRAQQALATTDASARAIAVGVLISNSSTPPPFASTLLPPAGAAAVAVTAPPGPLPGPPGVADPAAGSALNLSPSSSQTDPPPNPTPALR
jgi:Flp pilus assembly protein TadD